MTTLTERRILKQAGGRLAIEAPPIDPNTEPHPYQTGGKACKECGAGLLNEVHWTENQK